MYYPAMIWCSDSAVQLDGVNDFCKGTFSSTSGTTTLMNTGTISLWTKAGNISGDQTLFEILSEDENASIRLWYDISEEEMVFEKTREDGSNAIEARVSVQLSTLKATDVNVACTWESGTDGVKIYTGGVVSADQGDGAPEWSFSSEELTFYYGAKATTGGTYLGWIHNILIWNRVLTQPQLLDIYNDGNPKNEAFTYSQYLMLYHTVSEKDWKTDTDQIAYSITNDALSISFSGAIVKSHP